MQFTKVKLLIYSLTVVFIYQNRKSFAIWLLTSILLQQAISIVAGYNFDELIIKTNVFIDEYHDI
jgi:hypothetical protein